MAVPIAARDVAAAVGALLVLTAAVSVVGTLIVPRPVGSWRDPAEAWPDFVGWRVNYEPAAYAIAYALDLVPAIWSGPRRRPTPPITPFRPPPGRAG